MMKKESNSTQTERSHGTFMKKIMKQENMIGEEMHTENGQSKKTKFIFFITKMAVIPIRMLLP